MCGFDCSASSAPLLAFPLTFPSIFLISLFATRSPQFTSALVVLFSLFPSFLSLHPSWPLSVSVPTVRLLLTNEATAGSGASRALLLRARSVERHQSPPHRFSFLCLFFTYVFQFIAGSSSRYLTTVNVDYR